ncbi:presenilin-associated rhomboid-like protein, mitochondrial isoform X3 [Mytilus trossulus]|uniref:presenilin-associated rhomboid-like protein, mitochondrial isoform X1 n=1 Tax=Mytilus trossulus TaxID=6551 RepID=UPI0030078464
MATSGKLSRLGNNFIQFQNFHNITKYWTNSGNRKVLRHPERWRIIPSRGFRTKKSKIEFLAEEAPQESQRFLSLVKPIGFTVMVCGCSFTGAMIWQYEGMRSYATKMKSGNDQSTNDLSFLKNFGFRKHISSMWNSLTEGEKMVWTIAGFNIAVFLMWRLKNVSVNNALYRYFTCSPTSGHSVTSMLWSTFSHQSFFHLFANMYVFWSFSGVMLHLVNKEQMAAVFFSGGVISSLASFVHKIVIKGTMPSLGASGAICAMIGLVCMANPDSQLTIAFIGDILGISFSAEKGLYGLMTFDALGLLLGWKVFDHAAHLGGVLFGIWYWKYGRDLIWNNRGKVMQMWHQLRGKS